MFVSYFRHLDVPESIVKHSKSIVQNFEDCCFQYIKTTCNTSCSIQWVCSNPAVALPQQLQYQQVVIWIVIDHMTIQFLQISSPNHVQFLRNMDLVGIYHFGDKLTLFQLLFSRSDKTALSILFIALLCVSSCWHVWTMSTVSNTVYWKFSARSDLHIMFLWLVLLYIFLRIIPSTSVCLVFNLSLVYKQMFYTSVMTLNIIWNV